MPIVEYALPLNKTQGSPIVSIAKTSPMRTLITPEAQVELAQSGGIVMALFGLYLIVHETRLILQIIFPRRETQGNTYNEKPTS